MEAAELGVLMRNPGLSYVLSLGAAVLREGEPKFLRLGYIWPTINGGGGPTDEKPY
jgi:hypothetical protein